MSRIVEIIARDPVGMEQLRAARTLALPDWCIAAGFVRNRVWDALHGIVPPRPPAAGEARSNMHVGGVAVKSELSRRDREICDIIGPELAARGLSLWDIAPGRVARDLEQWQQLCAWLETPGA